MPVMNMEHLVDPRKDIIDRIGDLSSIQVWPQWLLLGIYQRPEKTAGGVYLSSKTREEDVYQGKIGCILKMGANCFVDDDRFQFFGMKAEVGDFVAFKISDGWPIDIGARDGHCRLLRDSDVRLTVTHPDQIW